MFLEPCALQPKPPTPCADESLLRDELPQIMELKGFCGFLNGCSAPNYGVIGTMWGSKGELIDIWGGYSSHNNTDTQKGPCKDYFPERVLLYKPN